ncbi:heme lyase CcmF/NrfE family subunit [Niveispirillum cyanobacteriorum]|uniref:Heme lyase NrfEFG subunit NrfE n=1 Tax=Niveispirillum cyanobacteriorum TaxID=1612173 RepID=A0A2K9NCX9_9PROT|nr:heme lyase CcmF/NrfE family subunit [Niveispirillum cyanobacteriorum]AUN30937.1 heme lyase NrfEFG subunit NrfE [Niveispirillum cyanobacteriorum]GGE80965.1 cytochrome c biogenesis protein CcmF [Niveispirillum cyanobacteriorum]
MIPEIGHYALVLALLLAVAQSVMPLVGAARRDVAWMETGRMAAFAQLAAITISFAALMQAHVVSDFSVLNVVNNSHSLKPMLYKVAGVWGNHEGSMLLWVFMLALFGAAVAGFGRNIPPTLKARVLGVQGLIGVGFLLFILVTSNPFARVYPAPFDGNDLNPLLQDPGLAFHPPFLYLGYVGFSVAFSFAVGALIEGRVDPAWGRWVRPWTLVAWTSLTMGIAMGSWWAYYELGWGGWWMWDPVENASLMPWLAGTALLHSAIVVEKRDALKTWTILLAILTFSLSLLGTFLVRSGVLTSVHAFAVDPQRGVAVLGLLILATGGGLLLFALRAHALKIGGLFAPLSREGALVLNNLLLSVSAAVVLIGTLMPLLLDAFGHKISVGAPYYNFITPFLTIPLILVMALGPFMPWKRADLPGVLSRMWVVALLTLASVMLALWLAGVKPVMALVGIAMAAWAGFGAIWEVAERVKLFRVPLADSLSRARGLPLGAWGTAVAHAGMGIAIAGMVGTTFWLAEDVRVMKLGDKASIAGYELVLDKVEDLNIANYRTEMGHFSVSRDGRQIANLTAERRWYPVAKMQTTEAAIHTTFYSDLYVVLGEENPGGGGWVVRLYHHPLVPWIWIGSLVMVLGGCLSLSDRRLRVGVPSRRAAPVTPALQPAE